MFQGFKENDARGGWATTLCAGGWNNSLKPWARLPDGRGWSLLRVAAGLPARGSAVDDLIQEFLVESNENQDRYDSELVKLESEPESQPLLSSIFRSIHSIKGACGFLGFQKLEKLAHAGENLLSKLRDGQIKLTAEIGSALLEAGDGIRKMLASIGSTGNDGEEEFPELIVRLKALQEGMVALAPSVMEGLPDAQPRKNGDTPKSAPPLRESLEPVTNQEPPKSELPVEKEAVGGPEVAAHAEDPSKQATPMTPELEKNPRESVPVSGRKKKHQPQSGKLGGRWWSGRTSSRRIWRGRWKRKRTGMRGRSGKFLFPSAW
jgi:chemotaxis protein histidine kinase CheA